jgi:ankyrin repeat protein
LLDHKADVNHADVDNLRPIFIACRAGHVDIVNLLLQCKADINVSDNDGVTPLSTACEQNRKDIVKFLLSKEAPWRIFSNYFDDLSVSFL